MYVYSLLVSSCLLVSSVFDANVLLAANLISSTSLKPPCNSFVPSTRRLRTACERSKRTPSYATQTSKLILSLRKSTSTLLSLVTVSKNSVRISSVILLTQWEGQWEGHPRFQDQQVEIANVLVGGSSYPSYCQTCFGESPIASPFLVTPLRRFFFPRLFSSFPWYRNCWGGHDCSHHQA